MPSNSPQSSNGEIFYNDLRTGLNHPQSALSQTDDSSCPFPSLDTAISNGRAQIYDERDQRIADLERKLDDFLFVLSSQSAKLVSITDKFERFCSFSGIELPEEKAVEKQKRDYAEKFSTARENANDAVLERRRTLSYAAADQSQGIAAVGVDAVRKRATSITRSCRDVNLGVNIRLLADSVVLVDHRTELVAMEYEHLAGLLGFLLTELVQFWERVKLDPYAKGMKLAIDTDKLEISGNLTEPGWTMKLDEDRDAAFVSSFTQRMTADDWEKNHTAAGLYQGWYWRNVIRGNRLLYAVDFHVDLRSRGPFEEWWSGDEGGS